MSMLFRIVYAAHARGTHHKLALDALRHLDGPDGELWQRLFLKHAELYMEGAKAPDDQFKDFKNHVLHVGDRYWGGAPEKTEGWYRRLVEALAAHNWSEAVYCAGITSHYYTDPIHPFHTGQTEAENNIHRAVEWSISRSYDDLKRIGESSGGARPAFRLTHNSDWLRDLVIQGAETSHRYYEALIAHYDINRGVVDPPAGLDDNARRLVGELVVYAAAGFGHILQRAFKEASVAPPDVSLTLDTVLAAVRIPVKALMKKLADRDDRRQVERMYDELKTTGRVEVNLPADDRMVRDLYRAEVLAPRLAQRSTERTTRVEAPRRQAKAVALVPPAAKAGSASGAARAAPTQTGSLSGGLAQALAAIRPEPPAQAANPPVAPIDAAPPRSLPVSSPSPASDAAPPRPTAAPIALEQVVLAPRKLPLAVVAATAEPPAPPAAARVARVDMSVTLRPVPRQDELADDATQPPPAGAPDETADGKAGATDARVRKRARYMAERDAAPRLYLAPAAGVVDAPSIGPKMAERLNAIGVMTVADLLAADADTLAELLDARGVKGDTVRDWQAQALLVCDVPGLRGTHAQLLVGAGFRDLFAVADCDPATLLVAVLRFAQTKDGERVLRSGEPPDIEKITAWVQSATRARDTRAA